MSYPIIKGGDYIITINDSLRALFDEFGFLNSIDLRDYITKEQEEVIRNVCKDIFTKGYIPKSIILVDSLNEMFGLLQVDMINEQFLFAYPHIDQDGNLGLIQLSYVEDSDLPLRLWFENVTNY